MVQKQWKPAAGKRWRDALMREHPSHGKVVLIPSARRKPGGIKAQAAKLKAEGHALVHGRLVLPGRE